MAHLKDRVKAIGHELGFDLVQIGSLAPLDQELLHYQHWLDQGYSADMAYLQRDPERRVTPSLTFPAAQSVIIVSVSYFSQPPEVPSGSWGRVARYAVGRDYHAVIRSKLRDFCALIEKELGRKIARRPVTDDAALYEQALARRHGLGFVGKNSLVIGPKLSGSYNFIAELFVDFELEPDIEYTGTCGNCVRCIAACPTNAIKDGAEAAMVDANLCISYLTIENKGGIALPLRSQLGDWVYGCDICQEVCPYNSKTRAAPWPEFSPENGVGHYLNLPDLLHLDDQSFAQRFELSPLRRPKRRGLVRNALVVMGNQLAAHHADSEKIVEEVAAFSAREDDLLLVEHAAWALAQAQSSKGRSAIDKILARRLGDSVDLEIEKYA